MEMIVVIVIIGILLAILVPGIIRYVGKAKAAACDVNRRELLHELYYEYGLNSSLTQEELQEYAENSGIKCTDGKDYKVTLTKSGEVPEITLKCVHSESVGNNEAINKGQSVYDSYKDMLEELQKQWGHTYPYGNNDAMRKKYFEQNGKTWPKVILEGQELYVQPYYKGGEDVANQVWTFATTNSGVENVSWNVTYVYDSISQKWYKHNKEYQNPDSTISSSYSITGFASLEDLNKKVTQAVYQDGRKQWIEVTDYREK